MTASDFSRIIAKRSRKRGSRSKSQVFNPRESLSKMWREMMPPYLLTLHVGTFPARAGLGRTFRRKCCPGYSGEMNSRGLFSSFKMRHTGFVPGSPPEQHHCLSLGQCFAVPSCRVLMTGSFFLQGAGNTAGMGASQGMHHSMCIAVHRSSPGSSTNRFSPV